MAAGLVVLSSSAEQVTVVMPLGKELPELGTPWNVGSGSQLSSTPGGGYVTGSIASQTSTLDGQVIAGGSRSRP